MRNTICMVLLTFLFFNIQAVKPDSLFSAANNLYSEEKYEDAAVTYEEILKTGYTSSEVLFNLGNSWFRSNKLGKARLYYEKALLLSPRDKAIRANLAYTETLLPDKFEEVPVFFLRKWIISLRNIIAPNTWSILALSVFFISFVFLVTFLFSKKIAIKKVTFYIGITFFFVSLVCLLFAFAASNHLHNSGTAILTEPFVTVKSAPRESGKDLFIIHEGAKVWLETKAGEWQEVRIADGRIGWLQSSAIERI